jgi:16S rRNA (guanine527-N7)-methyltransferase
MEESHLQLLAAGARTAGVPLDSGQLRRFRLYLEELLLWNRRCNLVSSDDPEEIVLRHVLDSLAMVPLLPRRDGRLLDIGSGGGFPGIPLKIARTSLDVVLLEASRRKASFLKRAAVILGLEGLEVRWERTEEYLRREGVRGSFDLVVSRAVFPPPRFAAAGAPFLRPGGHLLIMAGPATDTRMPPPPGTFLEAHSSHEYTLPGTGENRKIIIYIKSNDAE